MLLYYYFRVLSGRSFAFLRVSLWATSLVCFFNNYYHTLLTHNWNDVCVCVRLCVCVCLFFSPKKCLRPALKLEQKLFWASLDYWLFGRRVLHWQNQFLLLFKIYWNLTHRSNAAVSVAVAAGDDVNCAALLLLYVVSSSLPQFINGSHFSRSVKQSVPSLRLGLGSGFCAGMVQRFTILA